MKEIVDRIRKRNMKKSNNGFTLTEVLLSLAIIGVISAVSIPALISNVQAAKSKTAWKANYAAVAQSIEMVMMRNHGSMKNYFYDTPSGSIGTKPIAPALANQFKVINYSATDEIFNSSTTPAFDYKAANNSALATELTANGQLELANGAFLMLFNAFNQLSPALIWVDVNGYKNPPNIMGKDLFGVQVLIDGVAPLGSPGTAAAGTACDSSSFLLQTPGGHGSMNSSQLAGVGCSAAYLAD